jgi:SAM-dependent methyltransferase
LSKNSELSPGIRLPDLYATDGTSGWSKGMRRITMALLAGMPFVQGPFLDLGCGGGMFVHELAAARPHSVVLGVDLSATALAYAQERGGSERLLQVDVSALPLDNNSIGLITALDVLDQQDIDIGHSLLEASRVLRPGGLLLMRVSAYPWLWGPHDIAFNTGRRWRGSELTETLHAHGFVVERASYANSLLSPAIVFMRLLHRWADLDLVVTEDANDLLDQLLWRALSAEARWLVHHKFPFGISFYTLARKPKRTDRPE